MLHRIGALIAIVASFIALIASGVSLYLGADVAAVDNPTEQTVFGMGWWDAAFALVVLVLGVVTFFAKSRYVGLSVVIVSIVGMFVASSGNIALMLAAMFGGLMAFMARRNAQRHGSHELPQDPSKPKQ